MSHLRGSNAKQKHLGLGKSAESEVFLISQMSLWLATERGDY